MHRNQMEHGMSAQTATQAMAEIRLAMGEAAEPLLQVIRAEINRGRFQERLEQLVKLQNGRRP